MFYTFFLFSKKHTITVKKNYPKHKNLSEDKNLSNIICTYLHKKYICFNLSCLVPIVQALLSMGLDDVVYQMSEIFIKLVTIVILT